MQIKRILSIKIILIIGLIGLVPISCSDSSTGADESNIPEGQGMQAQVDGESWEAQGTNAFESSSTVDGQTVHSLEAIGALKSDTSLPDNEILSVIVYSAKGAASVAEDTYDAGTDGYPRGQIIFNIKRDGQEDTRYEAQSGEITVVEVTEDGFAGTFSGTVVNVNDASDTKEITEGGFRADFPAF